MSRVKKQNGEKRKKNSEWKGVDEEKEKEKEEAGVEEDEEED